MKPAATLVPRLRVIGGPTPAPPTARGDDADVRFELTFEVRDARGNASDAKAVDAAAVVRAWQEGLGLVPLVEGGWAGLPAAWMQKHGQRVADLLAAREDDGRLARHALPALAALCAELEHPPPPGLDRLAPLAEGFERLPERRRRPISPPRFAPTSIKASTGSRSCAAPGLGGVLADDMGLGKTLQAMCVFDRVREDVHPDAARADAGRLPDQRALQLEERARALPPEPARRRLSRAGRAASTRPPT